LSRRLTRPDSGVGVLTGEREQRVCLLWTQLVYGCGAHAGIGVLPSWLRAEFLENTHLFVVACKTQARSEVYTSDLRMAYGRDL